MNGALMMLGPHRFRVVGPSYESFERQAAARWETIGVVGRPVTLQFLGMGEETANIEGTVYPGYFRGVAEVEAMMIEAGRGTPNILVTGSGKVLGKWCIRSISNKQEVLLPDGTPQKVTFNIELIRYHAPSAGVGGIGIPGLPGGAIGSVLGGLVDQARNAAVETVRGLL